MKSRKITEEENIMWQNSKWKKNIYLVGWIQKPSTSWLSRKRSIADSIKIKHKKILKNNKFPNCIINKLKVLTKLLKYSLPNFYNLELKNWDECHSSKVSDG